MPPTITDRQSSLTEAPIALSKPLLEDQEIQQVTRVLKSGMIAQGPMVEQFEKDFTKWCGRRYAVAVNSGTAALHCALHAAGIRSGDEVITTPFTFIATANAILMQGAVPIFVDIEPDTYLLDCREIEAKITPRTKAILTVDLYGHIYNVEAIQEIARRHHLIIIEDAAQAHGATFQGKKAGSWGGLGCFSFYATKNMTTAEGGMVVTDDPLMTQRVKRFRHHGQADDLEECELGFNYRMTDIAAAIGLVQLSKVDEMNQRRRVHAQLLTAGLQNIPGLIVPVSRTGHQPVFHQYTVRITRDFGMQRSELIEHLKRQGIASGVYYDKPLHLYPQFRRFGYQPGDFPVAEQAAEEVLSLPVHPGLSEDEIRRIISAIKLVEKHG